MVFLTGKQVRHVSKVSFNPEKIETQQNILYASDGNKSAIYKYDENGEHEITSDHDQHMTRIQCAFYEYVCVIKDLIVRLCTEQSRLYFFSLEGNFVKTRTMPMLKDKELCGSYNENSILVRDEKTKDFWVVKLNGEATKINIDAEYPTNVCVDGKNLFVFCEQKKAVIKYEF